MATHLDNGIIIVVFTILYSCHISMMYYPVQDNIQTCLPKNFVGYKRQASLSYLHDTHFPRCDQLLTVSIIKGSEG